MTKHLLVESNDEHIKGYHSGWREYHKDAKKLKPFTSSEMEFIRSRLPLDRVNAAADSEGKLNFEAGRQPEQLLLIA